MTRIKRRYLLFLAIIIQLLQSCTIEPPLHLPEDEIDIDMDLATIDIDINLLWDYESEYEWESQWWYGWDQSDIDIFGPWDPVMPSHYNIYRYYTKGDPNAKHTQPDIFQVDEPKLRTQYKLGYYDMLTFNEVTTLDGVQSLVFDDKSTYEYITAYTHKSSSVSHSPTRAEYAYFQPEFLFANYYENLYITLDPEDYDYYDEATHTYFKKVPVILEPRTYIYCTQVVLHHNRGRVSGVDGSANLSGMSQSTNVNTGVTGSQQIAVNYSVRLKNNVDKDGEKVDIIGGRLMTFGMCNMNPSRVSRADAFATDIRNYIDVNMIFNNGMDSTFVFDVTDQVHERYKGGVLTIELDVDTIKIPSRSGGSGFDAVVKDWEDGGTHEFDM